MPNYLTESDVVLEWSADPLSDTTPTWTAVAVGEIQALEWWAGIDREGDDPQPGGMTVRLKNVARKWEPLFGSNLIDTEQRFRLTLDGVQEGVWYTTDFQIDYPAGTGYSEVIVTCSDGVEVLALDDLPELDPPDAQSYEDVVNFDQPWGYWRLGEAEGTRTVSVIRKAWRGKGKRRRKIKRRAQIVETAAEAGGASGPTGNYRNLPQLAQPGLIVGDPDTAVKFDGSQHVRIPLEDVTEFASTDALTVECWMRADAAQGPAGAQLVAGPENASNLSTFKLIYGPPTPRAQFHVRNTAGVSTQVETGNLANGTVYHIIGVYDGTELRIYSNGVLQNTTGLAPSVLQAGDTAEFVSIGRDETNAAGSEAPVALVVDEPAIYTYALSDERILAHYQAGAARGFPQQTAGARIAAIVDSDLWVETGVQTSGRDVIPQMQAGQARMEEISELMHAEGPRTLFFFNGLGRPIYYGHEFQSLWSQSNTVQATFGDAGSEIPYQDIGLVYDHETFNTVTASREGGPLVTHTDTVEEGVRRRRVNAEYTDLLLADDDSVESLAYHVLQLYKQPAMRPTTITVDGYHALTQIKALDVGHLIRVKRRGADNVAIDRATWIIGKHKHLDASRHLTCTYTLSRGFDGATDVAMAGITDYSAAGTAKAA